MSNELEPGWYAVTKRCIVCSFIPAQFLNGPGSVSRSLYTPLYGSESDYRLVSVQVSNVLLGPMSRGTIS